MIAPSNTPGTIVKQAQIDDLRCCPLCHNRLAPVQPGLRCTVCGRVYSRNNLGQIDFRVTAGDKITLLSEYTTNDERIFAAASVLQHEAPCRPPANSYDGPLPPHISRAQISYIPAAAPGQACLDLGCGNAKHRELLSCLGYIYYGLDYNSQAANDLADAHAIPCHGKVFDLVFSIAVLEHLANPFRALAEVYRVLSDAGTFVGTVAFLEPYHDNSFFHTSHLGIYHLLVTTGFEVSYLAPIAGWDVLRAQLAMGFGGHCPSTAASFFSRPFQTALACYRMLARCFSDNSTRHTAAATEARHAGAFFFRAKKA